MTTTDSVEWTLYATDLTTKQAILPAAESRLYLVSNDCGSGELKIPLYSVSASLVSSGKFIECSYRGSIRGGFFVEQIKKMNASEEEGGGQWLSVSGRGPMVLLNKAIVWGDGTTSSTTDFTAVTKANILITLLTSAQARGGLSTLTWDFDAAEDSNSVPWTDSETLKIPNKTSLLDVMKQFANTGIDFEMNFTAGGFVFSAYNTEIGTDKSESVYFRVGDNCEEVVSEEKGDQIQNAYSIAYKAGRVILSDGTSISAYGRSEEQLDVQNAQTAASATTYGTAFLDNFKNPRKGISVKLYDGLSPNVFLDYEMGDYITIDILGVETKYRILGIQCTFDSDQYANVVVELNSLFTVKMIEMSQQLDQLTNQWDTAFDENLQEVSYWAPLGANNVSGGGEVRALVRVGNVIYIGGQFDEFCGVSANNIVAYDISTGLYSALGDGLTGTSSVVDALVYDGSTYLIVCGYFTNADGVAVKHIARMEISTGDWSAMGAGFSNEVTCAVMVGSDLYVSGWFTTNGNATANYKRLAYWDGSWHSMEIGRAHV